LIDLALMVGLVSQYESVEDFLIYSINGSILRNVEFYNNFPNKKEKGFTLSQ